MSASIVDFKAKHSSKALHAPAGIEGRVNGPQAIAGSADCCGGGTGNGRHKACDFSHREVGNDPGAAGEGVCADRRLTAATAPSKVDAVIDWKRPFKVRNIHEFRLTPLGDETQVTWIAAGTNLYMMKVMEVFVGVNGLMGRHFEAGLENLKKVAER